jgi:uncharacterized protein YbjT (DUF2867 family)
MTHSMLAPQKIATVFGGTGFLGRYIVRDLARAGYIIKIATRFPESAYFLRPLGKVGQIVPVHCLYQDQDSIDRVLAGSDVVINCIGILFERRRAKFRRVHVDLAQSIAAASARLGVERFVHVSALGVDKAQSRYAKSKLDGERAVLAAFPAATILRPGVVFGPEDRFFNLFAGLARFMPVLPLIGGNTKLQPVYAGDVAASVLAAVILSPRGLDAPQGCVYELGGPDIITMRGVYQRIFEWTGKSRCLLPLAFPLAKLNALFLQFIPPRPLLTPDQVVTLQTDSVVGENAAGLEALGVQATAMGQIVPAYLERFRAGGRFSNRKTA